MQENKYGSRTQRRICSFETETIVFITKCNVQISIRKQQNKAGTRVHTNKLVITKPF